MLIFFFSREGFDDPVPSVALALFFADHTWLHDYSPLRIVPNESTWLRGKRAGCTSRGGQYSAIFNAFTYYHFFNTHSPPPPHLLTLRERGIWEAAEIIYSNGITFHPHPTVGHQLEMSYTKPPTNRRECWLSDNTLACRTGPLFHPAYPPLQLAYLPTTGFDYAYHFNLQCFDFHEFLLQVVLLDVYLPRMWRVE